MQGINMQEYYLDKIQKNISQIKKSQNICLYQSIHEDDFNVNNNYILNRFKEYNNVSNTKNTYVLDENNSKPISHERNLSMERILNGQYINNNNFSDEVINNYNEYYNPYNNKINNNEYANPLYLSNNSVPNKDVNENMLKHESFKYCKNKLIMDNSVNNSNNTVTEKINNFTEIEGNQCFNNSLLNNAKLINYKTNKSINKSYIKSDEIYNRKNINITNSIPTNKSIFTNYPDKKDEMNNNITLLSHINNGNNNLFQNKITCYENKNTKKKSDIYEYFTNQNYIHNNLDKINIKNIDKNCKDYVNLNYSKSHISQDIFHEIHSKNFEVNSLGNYNIKINENKNSLNNIPSCEGNDIVIKSENVYDTEKTTKNISIQDNNIDFSLQRCSSENTQKSGINNVNSYHESVNNLKNDCMEPSQVLRSIQIKDQIDDSRDDSLRKNKLYPIFYNNYKNCEINVDHLISNNLKNSKNINSLNKLHSSMISSYCPHLSNFEKVNSHYSTMFLKEEDNNRYKKENFITSINSHEEKRYITDLNFSKCNIEDMMETSNNFQKSHQNEKIVKSNLSFQKETHECITSKTNKGENSNIYAPFAKDKIRSSTLVNINNKSDDYNNEKNGNNDLVITNNINDKKKSINNLEKNNFQKEKENENKEFCIFKKYDTSVGNNNPNTKNTEVIDLDFLQDEILKEELYKEKYEEGKQDDKPFNNFKYIETNEHILEKRDEKENNIIENKEENTIKNQKIIDSKQNRKDNESKWSKCDIENIRNEANNKTEQILEEKIKNIEEKDINALNIDIQIEKLNEFKEKEKSELIIYDQLKEENVKEQEKSKKEYTKKKILNEIEEKSLERSNKVQEVDISNYNTNEMESDSLYIINDNISIDEKNELEKELELYFKKEGFLTLSNSIKISEKDGNDLCYIDQSKKNFFNFLNVTKSMNSEYSEKEYEVSSSSIDIFEDDRFLSNSHENTTNKCKKNTFCTHEYIDETKKKKNREKKISDIENKLNVLDTSNMKNTINMNCKTVRDEYKDENNNITKKNKSIDFFFSKNKNFLFIDLLKNKFIKKDNYLEDKLEEKYNILMHPDNEKEKNLIDKIIYCLDPSYINNTLDEKIKWKQKLKYMQEKFLESILCVSYPNHLWNETNFEAYLQSLNFNSLLDDTFIKYEGDLNINLFQKEEEIFSDAGNIGEGGFGIVTKMRFLTGTKYYAIKKISKDHIIKSQAAGQAYLEAKYHSVLSHVNIIKMYGCMQDDQYIYHILEFCSKGSIYSISKNFKKRIIPDELAYKYFCHVVNGLYYLNQMGIFHRDIKMENVLVDHKDNAKLSDFGLSAMILGTKSHSSLCGTLVYFSPEITSGNGYDWRSDIWSLGVLLYEMLVGDVPFDGTKTQIVESIFSCDLKFPDFVNPLAINLIKKALVVDVNKRIKLCELSSDPWMQEMWKMAFQKDLKKNRDIRTSINEKSIDFNYISTLIQEECFIKSSLNASLNYNMNKNLNETEINSIGIANENIDSIILETQKKLADYLDLEDFFMNEENIHSSDSISECHSDSFIYHLSDPPTDVKNEMLVDKSFMKNKMNHEKKDNENISKDNYNNQESLSQDLDEIKKDTLRMNENNDSVNNENTMIEDIYLINSENKDFINNENMINEKSEYNEVYSDDLREDTPSEEKEINIQNEKFHFPIKNISESLQINNENVISISNNSSNTFIINNNDSMKLKELNSANVDSNIIEEKTKSSSINNKLDVNTNINEDICISVELNNQKKKVEPTEYDMKEALDLQNVSNMSSLGNISNGKIGSVFLEKFDENPVENKNLDYYNDEIDPFKNTSTSYLSSLSEPLDNKEKSLCEILEMETKNNSITMNKSKNMDSNIKIINDCIKNAPIMSNENNDIYSDCTNMKCEEENDNNKNINVSSTDVNCKSSLKNEKFSEIDESYIPINVLKKKIGKIINESNFTEINLELRDSFLLDKSENIEKLSKNGWEEKSNEKQSSNETLKKKTFPLKVSNYIKEINNESNKVNNFDDNRLIYENIKENCENEKNFNELKGKAKVKSTCILEKLQNEKEKNSHVENIDFSITKKVKEILEKNANEKYHKKELFREDKNCIRSTLNESKSIIEDKYNIKKEISSNIKKKNDVITTKENSLYDKYIDKINELYQNIKNKKLINDNENIKNETSENDKILNRNDNIDFGSNKKRDKKNELISSSFKDRFDNISNKDDNTSKYVKYNDMINKDSVKCTNNNYFEYDRNYDINHNDNNEDINNHYTNIINRILSHQSSFKNTKLNDFCYTKKGDNKNELCKNKEILSNNDILKTENKLFNNLKDEEFLDNKLVNFKKKILNDYNSNAYIEKKEKTFLELKQKILYDNNLNIKSRITPDFFAPNVRNFHSSNSENGDFICEKNKDKYFHTNENSLSSSNSDYSNDKHFYKKYKHNKINLDNNNILNHNEENYRNIESHNKYKNKLDYDRYQKINNCSNKQMKDKENNVDPFDVLCFDNKVTFMASQSENESGNISKVIEINKTNIQRNNLDSRNNIYQGISNLELISRIHKNKLISTLDDKKKKKKANILDEKGNKQTNGINMSQKSNNKISLKNTFNLEINTKNNEVEKNKLYKNGENVVIKNKQNDKNGIEDDSIVITKRDASMKTTLSKRNNVLEKESNIKKNKIKSFSDLLNKNKENMKCDELINNNITKDISKNIEKDKMNLINDEMILNMEQKNEICNIKNGDAKVKNSKYKFNEIFLDKNLVSIDSECNTLLHKGKTVSIDMEKSKKICDNKIKKNKSVPLRNMESLVKGKNILREKLNSKIDERYNYPLNKKKDDNNNTKESSFTEKNLKEKMPNIIKKQNKFCNNKYDNSLVHENSHISTVNTKDKTIKRNVPSKDIIKNNINFVQKNKKIILETDLKNSKVKQYLKNKIEKIKNKNNIVLNTVENEKCESKYIDEDLNNNESDSIYCENKEIYEKINIDTDIIKEKRSVSEFSFSSNSRMFNNQKKNSEQNVSTISNEIQKCENDMVSVTQKKNKQTKTLSRSKSESIKFFNYSSTESDISLSFNSVEKNENCKLNKFQISEQKEKKKEKNELEEFKNKKEDIKEEEVKIRNKNIRKNICDTKIKNSKSNIIHTYNSLHRKINFSNIKSKINTNISKKSKEGEEDVINDKEEHTKLNKNSESNRRAKSAKVSFKSNNVLNNLNLNESNSITLKEKMKKKNNLINNYDSKKKDMILCKRLNSLPVTRRSDNEKNYKTKTFRKNFFEKNESIKKMKTSFFKTNAETKYEEELQNKLLSLNKKKIYDSMKNYDKNNINTNHNDCVTYDINKNNVIYVSNRNHNYNNNKTDRNNLSDNYNNCNYYENDTCNKKIGFNNDKYNTILCNNIKCAMKNCQKDKMNLEIVNLDEKEKFNYNKEKSNFILNENNKLIYEDNYFNDNEGTLIKNYYLDNSISDNVNKININNMINYNNKICYVKKNNSNINNNSYIPFNIANNNNGNKYVNKIDKSYHMNTKKKGDTRISNVSNKNEAYINEGCKMDNIYFNNLDENFPNIIRKENNNVVRSHTCSKIMNIRQITSTGSESAFINTPTNTIYTYEKRDDFPNFSCNLQNNEIHENNKNNKNIKNEQNKYELQMEKYLNTNTNEYNTNKYILSYSVQDCLNKNSTSHKNDEKTENIKTHYDDYIRNANKINNCNVKDIKGKKNEANTNTELSTIFKFAKNKLLKLSSLKKGPLNPNCIHFNVNSQVINNKNNNFPKSDCDSNIKNTTYIYYDKVEKENSKTSIGNLEKNNCNHNNYNVDMLNNGLVVKSNNCYNAKCIKIKDELSTLNNINSSHKTLECNLYNNSEKKQFNNRNAFDEKEYLFYPQKNKEVHILSTNTNKIICENHTKDGYEKTNLINHNGGKMHSYYNREKKNVRIAINKYGKKFFVNSSIHITK
ncbi:serine/threonine protein kinase, putative [Plasmodium gallinaceum]|uniref:Serine/threonine protein kinase, putative n=1 Tax=Plasmodium gallinaceum TaxID=5849 RepID=A0A1J1GS96_PLAGA|nr:serine/threonine protein kinase, putative [Plasmodium gallinaceum]CRG93923.1 serine/threonine protein kinase, putative [Plasmodium gallinaceum]